MSAAGDRVENWISYAVLAPNQLGSSKDDREDALAALARLEAVAEAARAVMRPDVRIKGAPLHGPDIFGNDSTVWAGLDAALRALDEEQT